MPDFNPVSIAFLVFPQVTQLDLMGPAQVFSRLGNARIHLVWKDTQPVMSDAGFPLLPTATFDEIRNADVLCVPGGFGTFDLIEDGEVLDWLRLIGSKADWVTSVCTGSLLLGAAGLLKGYRAGCHWASLPQLAYFEALPTKERVVFDRNRATGGGVTSGIDFALALTAKIRSERHAKFVQLSIEYDPAPPFDSGSPDKADPEILEAYWKMVEQAIPSRDAKIAEKAARLGFQAN